MSNDTKWTPGPWRKSLEKNINSDEWQIIGDGWGVTTVSPVLRAGGWSEGEANARLIAAAPDLYDALADLLAICEGGPDEPDEVEWASAALEKARGGS